MSAPLRAFVFLFAAACIAASVSSVSPAASAPGRNLTVTRSDGRPVADLKHPVLSSHLVMLADAASAGSLTAGVAALPNELRGLISSQHMRMNPSGEVQVYVSVDDMSALSGLASLGVVVERIDEERGILQAYVSAAGLRTVAGLPGVRSIRLPEYPFTQAGSVQTEGDAVIRASDVRSVTGVDGTGFTIGVISDGVGGLAASQGLGDLPAVDTATCNVVGGDPGAAGAEGTALLEIVHDIAPGAALMFGNFGFSTVLDFNAAVDCLAANADIVVDDIGWFGVGPYDGTSLVSQNTADALNGPGPIRGYYTSVGNQARQHYQGAYVDSGFDITDGPDFWDTHELDAIDGTVHAGVVSAPTDGNRFILSPGAIASVIVVWDDAWGASGNDYDLILGDGVITVPCGVSSQDGDDNPVEGCGVFNDGVSNLELDIYIGNYLGAAAPVTFDLFVLCRGCVAHGNGNLLDFNTTAGSVANQSDAGGSPASVVSVGAVYQGSPEVIQSYSSNGPADDTRLKPDLVAPDGVCITGSGGFAAGNPVCQATGVQFYGTSASAPHVAAAAALLLECDPGLSRVGLRDLLTSTAVDLGDAGSDNVYGHGRVDLVEAAAIAGCGPDTDGDGCVDIREDGADEGIGGQRDKANPWDFYDVAGASLGPPDQQIDLFNDIVSVIDHYAPVGTEPEYDAFFDRGPSAGPNQWNMTAPDGKIDLFNDIVGVISQFGHDCR